MANQRVSMIALILVLSWALSPGWQAPAHAYRLPDTGQTKCYDDVGNEITPCPSPGERFYGQDGNYSGPQPAYQDNGDGTVTDLNTGLMWQQGDSQNSSGRTWQSAVDYCSASGLADYHDWRLPNRLELMTIVNYGRGGPAINTIAFPNCRWTPSDRTQYWSSSTHLGALGYVWVVSFAIGDVFTWASGFARYVRCVRAGSPPAPTYVDNGNGTVTDTTTGLSWQKSDDGTTRTWEQALAYCEGLNLADRTDWRLPNVRELASITDDSRHGPAIDPTFSCRSLNCWSSSTRADASQYPELADEAVFVAFGAGGVKWDRKSTNLCVRCVRAGPSGSFDYLIFSTIASPQAAGAPFPVTITASDAYGNTDTSFNGTVLLSSCAGAVSPSSVTLQNGSATAQVKITSPGICTYLTASGVGRTGQSNRFTVNGDGLNTGYVMGFVKGTLDLPVSAATVYINNDCYSDSRTTNANGYFEFQNIPCSEYNIRAEKDAASSQTFTLKVVETACNFKELIISSASSQGKIPILLVPGIMGSSTSDGSLYPTLPEDPPTSWNSAEWKAELPRGLHDPWDPVYRFHRPGWTELIKDLESLGYEQNNNLFTVPCDWRMDWDKAAEKYLKPAIEHALDKTGLTKVNIVAHSMGGLLVRAYIQGDAERKGQINKFAMVGTPNHGSANPYYMYFGGDPKKADDLNEGLPTEWLNFYSNTTEGIYESMHKNERLFPLKRVCTSQNCFEFTEWDNDGSKKKARAFYRDLVPTVKGLLPVFPFLSTSSKFFGIEDNRKLESLNDDSDLEGMDIKIFAGKGTKTITNINVGKPSNMYPYGVPKSAYQSDVGDGTVPLNSARLDSIVFEDGTEAAHSELIYKYKGEIISFITGTAAASVAASTPVKTAAAGDAATAQLGISLKGAVIPYVIEPGGGKAGVNPSTGALENTLAGADIDMDSVSSDIVVASPADGVYTVQVKGDFERDYQVQISFMGPDGSTAMVTAAGFNHADTQSFTFTLDSAAENKLLLGMNPVPPGNLLADPYDSGGLKTRLSWDASEDPNVISYNVYSREETEPFMALLGSSADAYLQTSHPWAENSTISTRLYAVTGVKADGKESFLSEWAKNNDRDHDGLSDEEETTFGSDMTKADSDGDCLSDAEEYLHGTSPLLVDTDGDGYSDYVEIRAGTDPLDPSSKPAVTTTGVFRPDNGLIYLKKENTTGFADASLCYGIAGDIPIAGDWDGDGVTGIGIYRDGQFYLKNTIATGFADMVIPFGQNGDQPVVGDWDGDGVDTIGIFRNGQFLLRNSNSTGPPDYVFYLGTPEDLPIAGNWDGTGGDSCGVFRPTNGFIYLKNELSTGYADVNIFYGIALDKPVIGDWDGDGVDTIGVYRNGAFLLRNTNQTGYAEIMFWLGQDRDVPISGKWGLP